MKKMCVEGNGTIRAFSLMVIAGVLLALAI